MLEHRREEIKSKWEHGSIADFEHFAHALVNAGSIGECKAYAYLQELEYDQLLGEIDDGEPKRPETSGESSSPNGV